MLQAQHSVQHPFCQLLASITVCIQSVSPHSVAQVCITLLLFCRYALPEEDVLCQVQHALSLVGMEDFQNRTTHTLSGGQKQRVAIAGALAECPKVCSCGHSMRFPEAKGHCM